jgi:hypothetical protein
MNWTPEQIQKTLSAVTGRTMHDEQFRALALKDANAAVAAVTGEPVPPDFKIRFVDNAGYDLTVVLPDAPAVQSSREMSEDLAGVAGGTETFTVDFGNLSVACLTKNLYGCNPAYTKKPGNQVFCPPG